VGAAKLICNSQHFESMSHRLTLVDGLTAAFAAVPDGPIRIVYNADMDELIGKIKRIVARDIRMLFADNSMLLRVNSLLASA
jgi:hypothetical protein